MVTKPDGWSVLELPCVQTSAEALAMQFAQNAKYEPGHPEDQQAFVDARASLNRDEDELVGDSLENRPALDTNDPETPPPWWNQSSSRATRRRRPDHAVARNYWTTVRLPPQQLDLTLGELRAYQGASITDHWNHSGTAEPRFEHVERQQDRERDETNALIAFYTDRGVGYKYRPKKKGKKSKNINFETSDQFTQSGLTESRKVEWNKWKDFNAVYPVSGPELELLLDQGHKPNPLHNGSTSTKTSINDAKVVLMLLRCSKVDWSAVEIWRKPLVWERTLQLVTSKVEHSPFMGFVWAPHGQVGWHHKRIFPRMSTGTVDLNETTTWRSARCWYQRRHHVRRAYSNIWHMWCWPWFLEETSSRHSQHWIERKCSHPSTVHIPRRRRTQIHACDPRRWHAAGHEIWIRGSSATTFGPLYDKDGGIRYVSILWTRSDSTLWFFGLSQVQRHDREDWTCALRP